MKNYDKGDLVRVYGSWQDLSGTYVDPTEGYLTFSFRISPTGTIVTYTYPSSAQIVKDDVGQYHVDISCVTDDSDYLYRWASTGTVQAACEGAFHVRETNF